MSDGYGPDLRIFIGWLFAIVGGILTGYGALRPGVRSPWTTTNVNLEWGAVLLVFGIAMLLLGYRQNKKAL